MRVDWFVGTPEIAVRPVRPVRHVWRCPRCVGGEMVYNGSWWPTGDPGYHHTCSKCGFTTAINGHRYPEIVYEEAS